MYILYVIYQISKLTYYILSISFAEVRFTEDGIFSWHFEEQRKWMYIWHPWGIARST